MATVQIATQTLSTTAAAPTFTALNATDTYYVPNNGGKTVLYFKNTNGSICTVTFDITKVYEGQTFVDLAFTVPATTGERVIGGFGAILESASPQANKLKFSIDIATGVSVAAFFS